MSMTVYSYIEDAANNQAVIKVIGIGGGGCNAIERMLERQIAGVDLIACNTDMLSLQNYHAPTCLQLGKNTTSGWGAGGKPSVGRSAALEDEEMIRRHIIGSDMLFITAGMGGGTGTGGAPVIAQIARDMGILTVAVVTTPFRFEGHRRNQIAEDGVSELEPLVDTLIVVPNERILSVIEPGTSMIDAFLKADEVLGNAVQGISDLIILTGIVNVDFADVKTIMTARGKAFFGTGAGFGETHVFDAVDAAIKSELLDDFNIDGARDILVNFTSGDNLSMHQLSAACKKINDLVDDNVLIIFGHVYDPDYVDKTKVTIIATGFGGSHEKQRSSSTQFFDAASLLTNKSKKHSATIRSFHDNQKEASDSFDTDTHHAQEEESIVDIDIGTSKSYEHTPDIAVKTYDHLSCNHQTVRLPSQIPSSDNESDSSAYAVANHSEPFHPTGSDRDNETSKSNVAEVHEFSDHISKLDKKVRRMYIRDINTPAFLRRKAD
jgi:cell division protein FtsZ